MTDKLYDVCAIALDRSAGRPLYTVRIVHAGLSGPIAKAVAASEFSARKDRSETFSYSSAGMYKDGDLWEGHGRTQ
jgi:hypothetical protein